MCESDSLEFGVLIELNSRTTIIKKFKLIRFGVLPIRSLCAVTARGNVIAAACFARKGFDCCCTSFLVKMKKAPLIKMNFGLDGGGCDELLII